MKSNGRRIWFEKDDRSKEEKIKELINRVKANEREKRFIKCLYIARLIVRSVVVLCIMFILLYGVCCKAF